jgi:hypothetical protein
MKKIVIIILSIIVISCSQNNKPILKEYELIGNVKSVREILLRKNNKLSFDTMYVKNFIFNNKNKKIREFDTIYSNNVKLNVTSDLSYNSSGKLITEKGINSIGTNVNFILIKYIYLKNKLDRIESFTKKKGEKYKIDQIEKFVHKANLIKSIEKKYDFNKELNDTVCTSISKKIYDKNEQVIEIDDNKFGKFKFIRNEKGLVIETKYESDNKKVETSKYRYKFDENGSWISKSEYVSDTLQSIEKRFIKYK